MPAYDSDSSLDDDSNNVSTAVLLGYASKEPTGDDVSQLGGHPTWLDAVTAPDGALVKCRICNSLMSLLLQINGHLPDIYPEHERRLYIWACRRKACRRKNGSMRAFRGIRRPVSAGMASASTPQQAAKETEQKQETPLQNTHIKKELGETLFGVKGSPIPSNSNANPFAPNAGNGNAAAANPFSGASSLAAKPAQRSTPLAADALPETFAQKARISTPSAPSISDPAPAVQNTPWPPQSSFPQPYPTYYIDADQEYISAHPEESSASTSQRAQMMDVDSSAGSSSRDEDKLAFESAMDKTFQRFADRLSENPEQVLRYEYGGQALLYSNNDTVGKLLSLGTADGSGSGRVSTRNLALGAATKLPRCTNCGGSRIFELQLTPHAITELEAEDISLDGMDWGTIIMGVCSEDCAQKGKQSGETGYVEEWLGVQWEETSGGSGKGRA